MGGRALSPSIKERSKIEKTLSDPSSRKVGHPQGQRALATMKTV